MARLRPHPVAAAAVLVVAATLAGCSSGGSSASGCGPQRREALDQGYLQHVLPGTGRQPTYATDPPTSGPHQPAPAITGVVAEPLGKPVQVGLLESGKVLIQYKGVSAAELATVKDLAGEQVVVAPASELPAGDTVVATAWTYKLQCGEPDAADLKAFIADRAGNGPDQS